ncbi:MAG: sulfite exporter TauE/SafE family protein [Caulobacterales bacterium]|jgi:uncharacterized membrane protein YfcA
MTVYLPIAEMPVNWLLIVMTSGVVGFLSGMVGVGGGFVLTPILIFLGIPPPVAVATQASQICASSVSGLLAHARRNGVDWRLGLVLAIGGVLGGWIGVNLFEKALEGGQIDLLIALFYIVFCSLIGGLTLWESLRALTRGAQPSLRPRERTWLHRLPFPMKFETSGLEISIIPPLVIGMVVGILAAIMGIGGAFILTPALIYLLRAPTKVVIGTSLFQVVIVTALVTLLQAVDTQTVDLVLAGLLIAGGVVGAQFGARVGAGMRAEELRAVLGIVVLATGIKLFFDLIVAPTEVFTLRVMP